jgi:hypothetical protein
MCCLLERRGNGFVDLLWKAIEAGVGNDGLGIIVPENSEVLELVLDLFTQVIKEYSYKVYK